MPCWMTQISLGLTFILQYYNSQYSIVNSDRVRDSPSELSFHIQSSLLGDDEEVSVTVVHGPVVHGLVTREHVDCNPVPGLTVPRT